MRWDTVVLRELWATVSGHVSRLLMLRCAPLRTKLTVISASHQYMRIIE